MPAGGLVVKRRLADAALMEMRLNERKQQNEHNQKKGIVNRKIIPQTRRNVYPKQRFWVHIGRQERSCTPDGSHDIPANGLPADGGRQVCTVRRPAGIVRYIL